MYGFTNIPHLLDDFMQYLFFKFRVWVIHGGSTGVRVDYA